MASRLASSPRTRFSTYAKSLRRIGRRRLRFWVPSGFLDLALPQERHAAGIGEVRAALALRLLPVQIHPARLTRSFEAYLLPAFRLGTLDEPRDLVPEHVVDDERHLGCLGQAVANGGG